MYVAWMNEWGLQRKEVIYILYVCTYWITLNKYIELLLLLLFSFRLLNNNDLEWNEWSESLKFDVDQAPGPSKIKIPILI